MQKIKGPFITFEGGEGSGKSTQCEILVNRLIDLGKSVKFYREPGGTAGAEEIRNLLMQGDKGRWNAKTEALLMSSARADLIHRHIIPEREEGHWIICDRFADSTIAYQGYGHQLGFEKVAELNDFTIGDLEPDLTFVFQIDPNLGLERTALRKTGHYRFEQFDLDFHERVAQGYNAILKQFPNRCVPVDASLDIDSVSEFILAKVNEWFLVE